VCCGLCGRRKSGYYRYFYVGIQQFLHTHKNNAAVPEHTITLAGTIYPMRVLVFGASITQGFWDTKGGWVGRLRKYYDEKALQNIQQDNYSTIFNLGISGDTTAGLLKRLDAETEARKNQELAFIFSIGTNNAAVEGNGKQWSSPETYRSELEQIIEKARKYSSKIMLVGMSSCDETKTTPVFWQDINYTNDRMFEFEQVMRQVSREQNLAHVPVFEVLKEKQEAGEEMFADGLHPNNKGHELIFKLVQPKLDELLTK
jgi:lysophospholipase L1-like esterase